ncbi:hypothetical protein, partial [Xanthovirga aplysinae]|uniref:hypothetical protein n=1 Tax=Xanthovirga aplysinae TaxID=2529853 RepID=UPI00165745E3
GNIENQPDLIAKFANYALLGHTHSEYSLTTHDHEGEYKRDFFENTAFNRDFGNAANTVMEGNTTFNLDDVLQAGNESELGATFGDVVRSTNFITVGSDDGTGDIPVGGSGTWCLI